MRRGGHQQQLMAELEANKATVETLAGQGRWAGLRTMLAYSEPRIEDMQRVWGGRSDEGRL